MKNTIARRILNKLNEKDDSQDFDTALNKFILKCNAVMKASENGVYDEVKIMKGKNFIKVISVLKVTQIQSAYCFIEIATGNIFKADSWVKPAKSPKASIYNPETYANLDVYGSWLYKNKKIL